MKSSGALGAENNEANRFRSASESNESHSLKKYTSFSKREETCEKANNECDIKLAESYSKSSPNTQDSPFVPNEDRNESINNQIQTISSRARQGYEVCYSERFHQNVPDIDIHRNISNLVKRYAVVFIKLKVLKIKFKCILIWKQLYSILIILTDYMKDSIIIIITKKFWCSKKNVKQHGSANISLRNEKVQIKNVLDT